MTTLHHNTFTQSMYGTARRLFRPSSKAGILAPTVINAHTARDIGINLIGLR